MEGQTRAGEVFCVLLGPSPGLCADIVVEASQLPLLLLDLWWADRD